MIASYHITDADRNAAPAALCASWIGRHIGVAKLRAELLRVWRGAEFPCRGLARADWLAMFAAAGYLSDDATPAPREPVRVWRAQVGRTRGLSWTTDRDKALWFAARNEAFGFRGVLLETEAAPGDVLASVNARGEHELIVHPRANPKAGQP